MSPPDTEVPAAAPFLSPSKIRVMVMTPLRAFGGVEDLPKQIGAALRELATRGLQGEPVGDPTEKELDDYAFRQEADHYEFDFCAVVGGLCRAKNAAVAEAIKAKAIWVLNWDADLHPDGMTGGEAVLRLLRHRVACVGGIYCKRGKRPQWAVTWLPPAQYQEGKGDRDLLQVVELAGGFKLHHIKCFTELDRIYTQADKLWPRLHYVDRDSGAKVCGFYQQLVKDNDLLTEDYFLDMLLSRVNVFTLADTGLRLRHRGPPSKDHPEGESYPEGDFPPIPAPMDNLEVVDLVPKKP